MAEKFLQDNMSELENLGTIASVVPDQYARYLELTGTPASFSLAANFNGLIDKRKQQADLIKEAYATPQTTLADKLSMMLAAALPTAMAGMFGSSKDVGYAASGGLVGLKEGQTQLKEQEGRAQKEKLARAALLGQDISDQVVLGKQAVQAMIDSEKLSQQQIGREKIANINNTADMEERRYVQGQVNARQGEQIASTEKQTGQRIAAQKEIAKERVKLGRDQIKAQNDRAIYGPLDPELGEVAQRPDAEALPAFVSKFGDDKVAQEKLSSYRQELAARQTIDSVKSEKFKAQSDAAKQRAETSKAGLELAIAKAEQEQEGWRIDGTQLMVPGKKPGPEAQKSAIVVMQHLPTVIDLTNHYQELMQRQKDAGGQDQLAPSELDDIMQTKNQLVEEIKILRNYGAAFTAPEMSLVEKGFGSLVAGENAQSAITSFFRTSQGVDFAESLTRFREAVVNRSVHIIHGAGYLLDVDELGAKNPLYLKLLGTSPAGVRTLAADKKIIDQSKSNVYIDRKRIMDEVKARDKELHHVLDEEQPQTTPSSTPTAMPTGSIVDNLQSLYSGK